MGLFVKSPIETGREFGGSQGQKLMQFGDDDSAIFVRNVSKIFDTPEGAPFTAVQDINFQVKMGEFVSIVGPSGCGKSTILNLISGLLELSGGKIEILGKGRKDLLGYIFQKDALLPWKTIIQNISLALKFRNVDKDVTMEKARYWIRQMGLQGFEHYFSSQLSGGMRKRVALAMVYIFDPEIILMDEPFGSLDVQTRNIMENELLQDWEVNKKTILFVTHDLEEAISLSDRIIVMTRRPGRIKSTYEIDLPRPRNVIDIRFDRHFFDIHQRIWNDLRGEVGNGEKNSPSI